jgi:hypothetical protein
VAVREVVAEFEEAETVTVPLAVPEPPLVITSQLPSLAAVHEQGLAVVVTFTAEVPPPAGNVRVVGDIENPQVAPA